MRHHPARMFRLRLMRETRRRYLSDERRAQLEAARRGPPEPSDGQQQEEKGAPGRLAPQDNDRGDR